MIADHVAEALRLHEQGWRATSTLNKFADPDGALALPTLTTVNLIDVWIATRRLQAQKREWRG